MAGVDGNGNGNGDVGAVRRRRSFGNLAPVCAILMNGNGDGDGGDGASASASASASGSSSSSASASAFDLDFLAADKPKSTELKSQYQSQSKSNAQPLLPLIDPAPPSSAITRSNPYPPHRQPSHPQHRYRPPHEQLSSSHEMTHSSALLPKDEKQRLMAPAALPAANSSAAAEAERHKAHGDFNRFIGEVPFVDPNVHSPEDLEKIVNGPNGIQNSLTSCGCVLCGLTGIGLCYLCCSQRLIEQGELGFSVNNGKPEVMLPGRHLLLSPFNRFNRTYTMAADLIEVYPITIVRVPVGSLGLAHDNAHPVVLLPGLHCYNDGNWRFIKPPGVDNVVNGNHCIRADQEVIDFGPIKFITVKSGTVRVCYLRGKVHIFEEGRYAVNDPTCIVSNLIKTQQQNLLFTDHPVLLDGGISMLVKGLLTFQVIDVEKLIKKLGDRDLMRALEDVCQAEMSRVFSGVHLEQISSAMAAQPGGPSRNKAGGDQKDAKAMAAGGLLGASGAVVAEHGGSGANAEGATGGTSRSLICQQVIDYVTSTSQSWGVEVINFQLESLKLADAKYARDYEEASLAMAKAKANLRAITAENDILLSRANAQASAAKIDAEGKKQALIIKAQAEAEARKIEAEARNKAAMAMNDPFAKQFALSGQNVEFARALKANVLTIMPDSAVGKPFLANSMFNPAAVAAADGKANL